jgi:hypothetical protein
MPAERALVLVVVVVALLTAPVDARTAAHVTDDCGDADRMVWERPSAAARDGRWLTQASQEGSAGVNGPGAFDQTASGADFTVGATLP